MFIRSIVISICFYFISSTYLYADCSREDIEFYIDKGFTQEQITQLCAVTKNGGETAPDYTPYQQKVIIYKEGGGEAPGIKDGLTKEEREAVNAIKTGGEITKLKVTPQTISYQAKTCILAANSPEFDQRYKDCVDVDFVIQRKDLLVSASGKKLLLFGSHYVLLEGEIDAKPKRNWDEYPIEIRRSLQRNFEWKENGKKTAFPVNSDYSVARIVNAFRTLADTYVGDEETSQVAEADSDSTNEDLPKKPKKKKRWWNPFD